MLRVPELQKAAGTRCEHVCSGGCGVYESRPNSCKRFECLWLQGELPDGARPDRLGVIFTKGWTKMAGKEAPVIAVELSEGAAEKTAAWALIQGYVVAGRQVMIAPPPC